MPHPAPAQLQEGVLKTDSHGKALGHPEPGVCPEGSEVTRLLQLWAKA